jgi:hypothetical protein
LCPTLLRIMCLYFMGSRLLLLLRRVHLGPELQVKIDSSNNRGYFLKKKGTKPSNCLIGREMRFIGKNGTVWLMVQLFFQVILHVLNPRSYIALNYVATYEGCYNFLKLFQASNSITFVTLNLRYVSQGRCQALTYVALSFCDMRYVLLHILNSDNSKILLLRKYSFLANKCCKCW